MAAARADAGPDERVRLFDLKRQQGLIRPEIERRFGEVLDHGNFILGSEVEELESALAARTGASHAIAVSSGRDALAMAMMALGIGQGDAVFVPAFTFAATAAAVASLGAHPVFVDVDEETCNMDPAALDEAIGRVKAQGRVRPRAVMPVDLYGLPADYDVIEAVAAANAMEVVSDAAQSFGGGLGGRPVGTHGAVTATSFYPTKTLGAYGDGGALFTDRADIAGSIRAIRTHGRQGSGDEALHIGMTGRLDTLQAVVLLAKLAFFDQELARRTQIARAYDAALKGSVGTPPWPEGYESAWGLYTIRVADRDGMRQRLSDRGVDTGIFYARPLHLHAAFAPWSPGADALPVSEKLAASVLCLPVHPYLTDGEVERVIEAVRAGL